MELIGNKNKFAIEFWVHSKHRRWGSYCLWFENHRIGEIHKETEVTLGTLQMTLQGIIKDKMKLFDKSFVAKTDNQVFDIIYNPLFNRDLIPILSDKEFDSLHYRYVKFVFTSDIPIDNYLILNIYYKESNQFKFLIKEHLEGEEGFKDKLFSFTIDEKEFVSVVNEYSKKIMVLNK